MGNGNEVDLYSPAKSCSAAAEYEMIKDKGARRAPALRLYLFPLNRPWYGFRGKQNHYMNRRKLLKTAGLAALLPLIGNNHPAASGQFRFCLNTSTISGQKPGLLKYIDIAAAAGYDGVELWVRDIQEWLQLGNSLDKLAAYIKAKKLRVENAISFTEWMVDDETRRGQALQALAKEMQIMAALDCAYIAAPPAGLVKDADIDVAKAAMRYREILALGRKYQVMPLLEFWGSTGTLSTLSQAVAIAVAADDADARILPDVFHLFRGGSGFDGLNMLSGHAVVIIHANDYPDGKPAAAQTDADRVYPGDGVAPYDRILRTLQQMGGTKTLSLELFNRGYWRQDAFQVAAEGLRKMKQLVAKYAI